MQTSKRQLILTAIFSSAVTYFAVTARTTPTFAAEKFPPPAAEQPAPDLKLDESDVRVAFANAYRIHTTAEEVIIDFGLNMPDSTTPVPTGRSVYKISSRVILSYSNMKRLRETLSRLIETYEKVYGEISIAPRPPAAKEGK